MNKLKLLLPILLLAFGCEDEATSTTVTEEILTVDTPQKSYSCSDQFIQYIESRKYSDGSPFEGTACNICGETSALPGDTLFFEGNFFSDDIKLGSTINYSKRWEIEGNGAKIVGTNSSQSVAITFNENFSRVRLIRTNQYNGIICTDNIIIRNANVLIEIGDYGPAGGIVVYDKGLESDGWRYIEVGPYNIQKGERIEWGCYNMPIDEARSSEIGDGFNNTLSIVDYHNSFDDYYNTPELCSEVSDGSVAAKYCIDFEYNGFDDWFLPSAKEMSLIYELALRNKLWIETTTPWGDNLLYWTSTEHDDNTAEALDTENGNLGYLCKQCGESDFIRVLPIRYFK